MILNFLEKHLQFVHTRWWNWVGVIIGCATMTIFYIVMILDTLLEFKHERWIFWSLGMSMFVLIQGLISNREYFD